MKNIITFESTVGTISLPLNKIAELFNVKIDRHHVILEFNYVSTKGSHIKQFPGSFETNLDELLKIIQQIKDA